MQGFVLGMGVCFLIFSCYVKDKISITSKKIKINLGTIGILLLLLITYQLFVESTFLYVNSDTVKSILGDDMTSIEYTPSNDTRSDGGIEKLMEKVKELKQIINSIVEIPDYIKKIIGTIITILGSMFFYKQSLIKSYCENLEHKLYDIKHKWINGKTLKNILISVQVWSENGITDYDICKYFKQEFVKNTADFYMILGNPGEGKTVALRQICDMILQDRKTLQKNAKVWKRIFGAIRFQKVVDKDSGYYEEGFIPIMLDFAQIRNERNIKEFHTAVINHIYEISKSKGNKKIFDKILGKTDEIIESKMRQGKFVFLLDGYDEITEREREHTIHILNQYREKYTKCYFILASRTAVFEVNTIIVINKENIVHLRPFTDEKILQFLVKWEFNDKSYWELYEQIINNYQLRALASNPLLLTLISYLYENSLFETPASITEFYNDSMKCLLMQWDEDKPKFNNKLISKVNSIYNIDLEEKYTFLEHIANWIFHNNKDNITKKEIMNVMGNQCLKTFEDIYMHSGILENSGEQYMANKKVPEIGYKFYHRSFYEFFAAQYCIENVGNVDEYFKDQKNYRIAFFYFALSKDAKLLEEYLERNINNLLLIEPLLLECDITNRNLVLRYVYKKIEQKYAHNETYYQILGNIAYKYRYTNTIIYNYFIKEMEKEIENKNMKLLTYIVKGLSYFCDESIVSNVLLQYFNIIEWEGLTTDSNVQLNDSILFLVQSKLQLPCKIQILDGLRKSSKFSLLYHLFQKVTDKEMQKYIIYEFLQLTKDTAFISWFDKQNIFSYLIDKEIKNIIVILKNRYGWKWNNNSDEQILNRYVLVYYLLNLKEPCELDMKLVSNRIKFVSSYIKNMQRNQSMDAYYIDIPEYKIVSSIEFKFHWDNVRTIDRLLYNPTLLNNIQWTISIILLGILMMRILLFKFEDNWLMQEIYVSLEMIKQDDIDKFYKINYELSNLQISYLQISKFMPPNSHMIIFYFLWIYLQVKTFRQYIDSVYNRMYCLFYGVITLGYLVGYYFIFQDFYFRIVGALVGILLYLIAIFQHRNNMPSFRNPQFNRIRKYLENDNM